MSHAPEIKAIKSTMKSTWEAGNYGTFATYMEPGAIEIFMTWNIGPGQQMLDVGCGAG
jgi:ubiquinone/menaquinone biosynthesis C-methylase UbiE